MKAPFPWFGGKARVAEKVWEAFGPVPNYVEPFFGSGAVLLARKDAPGIETINDKDGFVSNFWRAMKYAPLEVAEYASWPVNENDLHARHAWLVSIRDGFISRLEGDPDYFDAKVAGWWVWGLCSWIGSGWCSGDGPWSVSDGMLTKLGDAGRGINRQLPHLGDAGRGINRQRPHLGDAGQGINRQHLDLTEYFAALSARLQSVRVASGDWTRVMGPSVTECNGLLTGIFLDPPYSDLAGRNPDLYREESLDVAHDVREWAIKNGNNPKIRIALCGYAGEHSMPDGWTSQGWKTKGGYGSQGDGAGRENSKRETLWLSPYCLQAQESLFSGVSLEP